jgi:hypothetical protein
MRMTLLTLPDISLSINSPADRAALVRNLVPDAGQRNRATVLSTVERGPTIKMFFFCSSLPRRL